MMPSLVELSKRAPLTDEERKKRERTEARVGQASNLVGLAAGGAATVTASREYANARRVKAGLPPKVARDTPVARALRHVKAKHAVGLAGGALLLQGANVGGDIVANRVLGRAAKKEPTSKRLDAHAKASLGIAGTGATYGLLTATKPETLDSKDGEHRNHPRRKRRVRKDDTMTGDSYSDVYESEGRGDGRGHSLTSIEKAATRATPQMMLGTELPDEEIMKRARRYDPEADRQRRTGLYAGLGAGGSALAGSKAADRLAGSVDRKARTVKVPRVNLKGLSGAELKAAKRSRAGLGLAALSAGLGAGSAATYRHGISRRNQPYN